MEELTRIGPWHPSTDSAQAWDRRETASTHYEVPDIRKGLSQLRAEVGMCDGD